MGLISISMPTDVDYGQRAIFAAALPYFYEASKLHSLAEVEPLSVDGYDLHRLLGLCITKL